MSFVSINNVLSHEEIENISNLPEVLCTKKDIECRSHGSIYFSIKPTSSLKQTLFEKLNLKLDTIPMRWIKGDTLPHIDIGSKQFEKTHLVYLTDNEGSFVIEDQTHSITKGTAFIFDEGMYHKTINTGSEPRLLLGPMSEHGIAVGLATILSGPGGTSVYIKQEDTNLYYSYNNSSWNLVYLPVFIENTNTSRGMFNVIFTTDISLTNNYDYLICTSNNIQFGSKTLNNDGTRRKITINVNNYDGFIENGTNIVSGYSNIHIFNLIVDGTGNSTQINGGWLCKQYFGSGATNNYIINCSSSGDINGGGILGAYAASGVGSNLTVIGCSNTGDIGVPSVSTGCGGIFGMNAASDGGTITCRSSWNEGNINNDYSGGIFGSNAGNNNGNIIISDCYSEGEVIGVSSGGIVGYLASNINLENCYTLGDINGNNSGGIIGSDSQNCIVINTYSAGAINAVANAGGIFGTNPTNYSITNSYTCGRTTLGKGFFVGNSNEVPVTCYSEAYYGTFGWTSANAVSCLFYTPFTSPGVGTVWAALDIGRPFFLYNMGYTPYLRTNISGTNLVRTISVNVNRGGSTSSAIISGKFYNILEIRGEHIFSFNTISINENTGVVSTTMETTPGTYTLYIYNRGNYGRGSYNVSSLVLTIVEPKPKPKPKSVKPSPVQKLGFNQKSGFCGTRPTSTTAVLIGSIRGAGSTTRIFNYCLNTSKNYQNCKYKSLGL